MWFYIAGAWLVAAIATLLCFIAVSIDDFGDVCAAAVRGSAAAMWAPPAFALLALPNPWAQGIALALIAAAAAMLARQQAPHRLRVRAEETRAPSQPMFRDPGLQGSVLAGALSPILLGALAMQSAVACWYGDAKTAAALLIAFAAFIWMRSWVARNPPPARKPRMLPILLFSALLASGLVLAERQLKAGSQLTADSLSLESAVRVRLANDNDRMRADAARNASGAATRAVGGSGMAGVILRRSGSKPSPWVMPVASAASAFSAARPAGFPFSGEYQIFRTSSGSIPDGSKVDEGSPMQMLYGSTNSEPIETQAYQPLHPPLSFAGCGGVEVTFHIGEFGVSATLLLITAAGTENIGTEYIGLDGRSEETVQFRVPDLPHRPPVEGIRVLFHHSPLLASQSTKAEVVRFALQARGY